ncbi:MAG: hypothetical protein DI539_21305 [Flavobacterium psychrophilum]|nr:MAG: hypothetical protein DI539_21305 [Flavobacterium psychrophilum]
MNFATKLSYRKRISFIYNNGETISTPFTEVLHQGDDYILAKREINGFYSVLDLNGIEKDVTLKVLHRFKNGFLLTYRPYSKSYKSSDGVKYFVNYNIYSILDYSAGKYYTIGILQADQIKDLAELKVTYNKDVRGSVTSFNNPLYHLKDFIFSEIFDNQYILTAKPLMVNPMSLLSKTGNTDLDIYYAKRIWAAVDIFQKDYLTELAVAGTNTADVTFEEAETELMNNIDFPESPDEKLDIDRLTNKNPDIEFIPYKSLKKKNKWQKILSSVVSFVHS